MRPKQEGTFEIGVLIGIIQLQWDLGSQTIPKLNKLEFNQNNSRKICLAIVANFPTLFLNNKWAPRYKTINVFTIKIY